MSETLYDVFITGKLKAGVELPQARESLARLFKIPADKAAQLVCGKPQLIKKAVDKAQAQRLMKLLKQAGLETGARKSGAGKAPEAQQQTVAANSLQLSPEGTPVLREEERRTFTPVAVDTSGIRLASAFSEPPAISENPPAIPAPDFGLAPAGSPLEQLPENAEPLNPDTSALSLAEPGVILGEIKSPPPPPAPSTEHLQLQDQS